ncbi:basic proline-rich protein-like [Gavia stellata]|uniref:basic proline-rich protein-like n=1 Tax=Gavia stellata TaxID=37040 RepID=UPI0028A211DF|nr:basic proline-rich protein-like [Gavia stellata]
MTVLQSKPPMRAGFQGEAPTPCQASSPVPVQPGQPRPAGSFGSGHSSCSSRPRRSEPPPREEPPQPLTAPRSARPGNRGCPVPPGLGRPLRPAPPQPRRLPLSRRSLTAAEPAAAPPQQRPEPHRRAGRDQGSAGPRPRGPAPRPAPAEPVRTCRREGPLLRRRAQRPLPATAASANCCYPGAGSFILA